MNKHLRLFQTHAQYTSYINGEDVYLPNVSYCNNENDVHYNPFDFSKQYLRTVALESGTISFNIMSGLTTECLTSISYSIDDGETWTTTANQDNKSENLVITVNVNEGDKVLWKGNANTLVDLENSGISFFTSTARFNADGNAMSLCYGDNFIGQTTLLYDYQFAALFGPALLGAGNVLLVNARDLVLPATTLTNMCYYGMFSGCTSLTKAPNTLSATTLASHCCEAMFSGCTSLVNPPQLPATTLATDCYTGMFSGCSSLTKAPDLSATTLAESCYESMFNGCTALTTAPALPATTLADSCYETMFYGCSSLTTATELPATILANGCYGSMFVGCTSLTTAPVLPATTLVNNCYDNMFNGCSSLTTAPVLPATTLASNCYGYMFNGCTALTTAPALPATTLANGCYQYMFSGCTSLTNAPVLPAIILANGCYGSMFRNCSSLTSAPQLPATTLANGCYGSMFVGCTSLTTAPVLPATTLADGCYSYMFSGCSNLNHIKAMFTTTPSITYTRNWVQGVAASGTFVMDYSALWNVTGVNGIPSGWTVEYENEPPYTPTGYALQYLKTTALESGTIGIKIPATVTTNYVTSISYSTDNGETWTQTNNTNSLVEISVNVTANQEVLWKGDARQFAISSSNYSQFYGTASFNVEGNVMSLCYGDNFANKHRLNYTYQFADLFKSSKVVNASNLSLPADALVNNCYDSMFYNCTALTSAPVLPATTLANNCYQSMFNGCSSLTTAPVLPATTLTSFCYAFMFKGCTSLVTAPNLPATTLDIYCYEDMFRGCTALTTAPELPATTLASRCYETMFNGCSRLNYIKAMFTTTPSNTYTQNWVTGVAAGGTFVKNSAAQWDVTGVNGVPSGWTVQTASV